MCPDESLISAYVDGEVPSPWRERLELHFRQCNHCALRLQAYRNLSEQLKESSHLDNERMEQSLEHLRQRFASELMREQVVAASSTRSAMSDHRKRLRSVWMEALMERQVRVPLPVLAASIALMIFFAGLAFGLFGRAHAPSSLALQARLPINYAGSIESLANTLVQPDPSQIITVNAPAGVTALPAQAAPVYVIYKVGEQAPTIVTWPAEGQNR
ncbi:MAG: zf-HC2 domain-containing protein [Spirochaetaceae bacterium]|nr:zf-HC2 domain-containing protein [Spirochaetaceae bacterium]